MLRLRAPDPIVSSRCLCMFAARHLTVPAAFAVSVALAACGGSSSSSKSTSSAANTPAAAPTATTPSTPAATKPGTVAVTLKEFTITPNTPSAPAGKVTFAVSNAGQIPHEFVVVATNKQAAELAEGTGSTGGEASEKGKVDELGDLTPGTSKSLTVTLKPGHYVLLCNLPGHYAAGQHTDFTVH